MKREPAPIKIDEVFAEVERLRKTAHHVELTPDQIEVLRRARTGQRKVSYPDLVKIWEKAGWGKVTDSFLRNQYQKVKLP